MNKKAQFENPLIIIAVLIIGLLMFAPIMLKIFNSIKNPVSASLGNITNGGATAKANYDTVMNTTVNLWDKVMVASFILLVILLFTSAFFIDAHPFFIILYILSNFFLILFAPNIIDAVDKIYNSASFATESASLSFMNFIRVHYGEVLVGLMVISGIIIYGKISYFGGNGRR